MPVTQEQLRAAGFSSIESYRDDVALRLLCAFNGVDAKLAPPAWWAHPNASSREAWKRVADEARRIFLDAEPFRAAIRAVFDAIAEPSEAMITAAQRADTGTGRNRWGYRRPLPRHDRGAAEGGDVNDHRVALRRQRQDAL